MKFAPAILIVLMFLPQLRAQEGEWIDLIKDGGFVENPEVRRAIPGTGTRNDNNALVTYDESADVGSFYHISYPVEVPPEKVLVVEAKVRVISGLNAINLSNGTESASVRLLPEQIEWRETRREAQKVTNDQFHLYRLTLRPENFEVVMDDTPALEGPIPARKPGEESPQKRITFGSGNSSGQGEAQWEFVRYRIE